MLATLAAFVLLALPTLQEAPRAQVNPWAQWNVGAWVLYDIDNPLSGKLTNKLALTALGEATYTCRDESDWEGGSNAKDSVISLGRFGYPHALPDGRQVASATLNVGGREFECAVWKARFIDEGVVWEATAWVAPDFEHPLRVHLNGNLQIELDVDKLEDYVLIGKRKFKGARYSGSVTHDGKRSSLVQWRSSDIPGGMLRSVTTATREGMTVVHTTQVREFRGTKRD